MNIKGKKIKLNTTHSIIALVFIYILTVFIRQDIVMRDLKHKNEAADVELKELKHDVKSLKIKIDQKNEAEYIERIAREEFDMIKSNEIIYRDKNKEKSSNVSD